MKTKNTKNIKDHNLIKRQIILITGIFTTILILSFSFTYMWLRLNEKTNESTILSNIEIKTDTNTNNSLILDDPFPMTEAGGMSKDPYKFSLINNGKSTVKYALSLVKDETTTNKCLDSVDINCTLIPIEALRFSISKNQEIIATGLLRDSKFVLDLGILEEEEKAEYNLKIWVDSNYKGNVSESKFFGKLDIKLQAD